MTTQPPPTAHVRPSTLDDYQGIAQAVERAQLFMVSRDEYIHRWSQNPFRRADAPIQTGWVMETDQHRIVGWVGNILQGFELNGRPLLAACAHAVSVEPDYRTRSLGMLASFFRQTGVDLLLSTTANSDAGQVYGAFKAARVPNPWYDRVLYWIIDAKGFAAAALRKKEVPGATAGGWILGAGLAAADLLRGQTAPDKVPAGVPQPCEISEFDDRFDQLWSILRRRPNRLHAVRSREALAWHYHDAGRTGRRAIVILEEAGAPAGFAVLIRRDAESIGLRRFGIADLQVARDDPNLVRALLAGAVRAARNHNVHVLEATGLDAFKRGVLESLNPRVRQTTNWPYFYKAQSPELAETLKSPEVWDPCPYDGDAAF